MPDVQRAVVWTHCMFIRYPITHGIWIYDFHKDHWEEVGLQSTDSLSHRGVGWAAGAATGSDSGGRLFIWGGLNYQNERIGLGWQISL